MQLKAKQFYSEAAASAAFAAVKVKSALPGPVSTGEAPNRGQSSKDVLVYWQSVSVFLSKIWLQSPLSVGVGLVHFPLA